MNDFTCGQVGSILRLRLSRNSVSLRFPKIGIEVHGVLVKRKLCLEPDHCLCHRHLGSAASTLPHEVARRRLTGRDVLLLHSAATRNEEVS